MSKKEIDPETASQIKKELAELRAQLENQKKSKKKAAKPKAEKKSVKPKAEKKAAKPKAEKKSCLLYTSPSPRDRTRSRMPSSA